MCHFLVNYKQITRLYAKKNLNTHLHFFHVQILAQNPALFIYLQTTCNLA